MTTEVNCETVTLKFPVEVDGRKTEKLTMRRPKARDRYILRKLEPDEQEVQLMANLCNVGQEAILDLDWVDYVQLQETLAGFSEPPASGS